MTLLHSDALESGMFAASHWWTAACNAGMRIRIEERLAGEGYRTVAVPLAASTALSEDERFGTRTIIRASASVSSATSARAVRRRL